MYRREILSVCSKKSVQTVPERYRSIRRDRLRNQRPPPIYRKLSAEEAYKILDNLGQRPLDVGDEGVRISGAGSQEKLVACVQNGTISLPLYGTPSTHIIKPVIPNFQSSVHNEYLKRRSFVGIVQQSDKSKIVEMINLLIPEHTATP